MGGLVQAAGVAANLRSHGMVTSSQILLAMLVASAIGNPIRALRRNLPSAMGIFPTRDALTIVVVSTVLFFLYAAISAGLVRVFRVPAGRQGVWMAGGHLLQQWVYGLSGGPGPVWRGGAGPDRDSGHSL